MPSEILIKNRIVHEHLQIQMALAKCRFYVHLQLQYEKPTTTVSQELKELPMSSGIKTNYNQTRLQRTLGSLEFFDLSQVVGYKNVK